MTGYNFSFGLLATNRLPVLPFDGDFGVHSTVTAEGRGDGFEKGAVIEKECQERLANDADC